MPRTKKNETIERLKKEAKKELKAEEKVAVKNSKSSKTSKSKKSDDTVSKESVKKEVKKTNTDEKKDYGDSIFTPGGTHKNIESFTISDNKELVKFLQMKKNKKYLDRINERKFDPNEIVKFSYAKQIYTKKAHHRLKESIRLSFNNSDEVKYLHFSVNCDKDGSPIKS